MVETCNHKEIANDINGPSFSSPYMRVNRVTFYCMRDDDDWCTQHHQLNTESRKDKRFQNDNYCAVLSFAPNETFDDVGGWPMAVVMTSWSHLISLYW